MEPLVSPRLVPANPQTVSVAVGTARINGETVPLTGDAGMAVALFLRDILDLKGTKIGCGNGECGACTIIVDGLATCSCLLPLHRIDGADVLTIEGLSRNGDLHPIQQALHDHGAFQCGFCTPGMVMSIYALLAETPSPSRAEIISALQGNICRCSGYVKLLEAIESLTGRQPS